MLGVDHSRQLLGVLHHVGHVHDRPDVAATVAHEDAYPDLLLHQNVLLHRQLHGGDLGAPRRGHDGLGPGGGRRCLGHGVGDVLGSLQGAADVDAWPGGVHGAEDARPGIAHLVQLDVEGGGQLLVALRWVQTRGEHNHVEDL